MAGTTLIERLAAGGVGVIGIGLGLLTIYQARLSAAREERIKSTETTAATDLQPGRVELKGTAQVADETIPAPTDSGEGVAVELSVYEYTGGGRGASWNQLFDHDRAVPFTLVDDTGEARIEPPTETTYRLEGQVDRIDAGDEPPERIRRAVEHAVADSDADPDEALLPTDDRRRYTYRVLEPGEDTYVLGEAVDRPGWEQGLVVTGDEEPDTFVLSDKSEEKLTRNTSIAQGIFYVVGAGLIGVGLLFLLAAVFA